MNTTTIVGIIGTISTIIFAYLAFRRGINQDLTSKAASEGALLSDIKYIKSSIDRMEKKMDKLDTNYNELLLRVIKLEERLDNHIEGEKVWAY